jgi:hypothetical protein
MNTDELRAIMDFLTNKVHLTGPGEDGQAAIGFDAPTLDEMARAGLNAAGSRQILDASWFEEMVVDIIDTPQMCDPEDPPEQVLQYARDVVSEYIRKRAEL